MARPSISPFVRAPTLPRSNMSTSCALRMARRPPTAAPGGVGRGVSGARFGGGGGGGSIFGAGFAGGALMRASNAAADG
eukprot:1143801-Lingulodinium_polyedra.AAC.1